jgi:CheY-like chemotaxis protein
MIEHDVPCIDGITACCAIRQAEGDHEHRLPVIAVSARKEAAGAAAGVTD